MTFRPSVQALVDYGIQGMKIASADLTNHELLRDVASRGLPMLVSTLIAQFMGTPQP